MEYRIEKHLHFVSALILCLYLGEVLIKLCTYRGYDQQNIRLILSPPLTNLRVM